MMMGGELILYEFCEYFFLLIKFKFWEEIYCFVLMENVILCYIMKIFCVSY